MVGDLYKQTRLERPATTHPSRNGVQGRKYPGASTHEGGSGYILASHLVLACFAHGKVAHKFDATRWPYDCSLGPRDRRRRRRAGRPIALNFKSYDQGRSKWQADTLDFVWLDEEPPLDIYSEGLTRVSATRGMVYATFTPLLGMSDVVRRFLLEPSEDRININMTIDDALHYTPEERAKIIAGYPAHEREARAKGIPTLGSGRFSPCLTTRLRSRRELSRKKSRAFVGSISDGITRSHPSSSCTIATRT